MNKAELIEAISDESNLSKADAKRALDAFISVTGKALKKDDKVAKLVINYDGNFVSEHDLLALDDVKRMNIISRILKSINYLIWGDV